MLYAVSWLGCINAIWKQGKPLNEYVLYVEVDMAKHVTSCCQSLLAFYIFTCNTTFTSSNQPSCRCTPALLYVTLYCVLMYQHLLKPNVASNNCVQLGAFFLCPEIFNIIMVLNNTCLFLFFYSSRRIKPFFFFQKDHNNPIFFLVRDFQNYAWFFTLNLKIHKTGKQQTVQCSK